MECVLGSWPLLASTKPHTSGTKIGSLRRIVTKIIAILSHVNELTQRQTGGEVL